MLKDFLALSALTKGGSDGDSPVLAENERIYQVGAVESVLSVSGLFESSSVGVLTE